MKQNITSRRQTRRGSLALGILLLASSLARAEVVNSYYTPIGMTTGNKGGLSGQEVTLSTAGFNDASGTVPGTLYLQEMVFIGAPDGTSSGNQFINLFSGHGYSGTQIVLTGATLVGSSASAVNMPINNFQGIYWPFNNVSLNSSTLYAVTWYTSATPGTSFTTVRLGGFVNPGAYPGGKTTTASTAGGDTWFYAVTTTAQQDFNAQNITSDTTLSGTFNDTGTYSRTGFRKTGGAILSVGSGATVNLTGDHVIEGGRLKLTTGGAFGSGAIDLLPQSGVNQMTTLTGTTLELNAPSASDTLTVPNAIKGPGSLDLTGSGTVFLTGANTYAGGTTNLAATLSVGNGGGTGALGTGRVTNNGVLVFNRTGTLTVPGVISGSGSVTQANTGVTILTANNTFSGEVTVSAGALQIGDGTSITATPGSNTVTVGDSGTLVFNYNAVVSGGLINNINGTGTLIWGGPGQLPLTGSNMFSGLIQLTNNGVNNALAFRSINSAAGAPRVSISTTGAVLALGSGFAGQTCTISELSGSGIITPQFDTGNGTKTLNVNQTTNTIFSGSMKTVDARVLAFTKSGSGTMTLTGTNTHTGATLVSQGTLFVNGSNGNSVVTVNGGAILGGAGIIGGSTTVNGQLAPGTTNNTTGLLSFAGALTFGTAANGAFQINGLTRGTDYDAVHVGGALTLDGTITVTSARTFAVGEAFQLFSATSINALGFNVPTDLILPALVCPMVWDTSTFTADGTIRVAQAAAGTPPAVASTSVSVLGSRLRLHFTQAVMTEQATNLSSYALQGSELSLIGVVQVDSATVDLLTTPAPVSGNSYTVLLSNLRNCASDTITNDTPAGFTTPSGFPLMNGLVAAFDGSSAAASPVDGVNWHDLSGNENHAVNTVTNASRRPTLQSGALNGHDTLKFVRNSSQTLAISAAAGLGLGGSNHTWFFVVKPTYLAAAVNVIRHQSSLQPGNWGSFFFQGNAGTGNQPALTANGRTPASGAVEAVAYPVALSNWVIGSGFVDGGAGNVYSRVLSSANGAFNAATNVTGTATGLGTPIATWIGSVANSTFFDGEMAEVLIYTNALSAAECAQVEDYLRLKYFPAPQVLQEPASIEKSLGEPASFTAVFTNAGLIQWYKDGFPILNATNATFTIAAVAATDLGEYMARATNISGFADTTPATLLVLGTVTGTVALEAYVGPARDGNGTRFVTFTATGDGMSPTSWSQELTFAPGADGYGVASFVITNLPFPTTHLSAKTSWNLRKRLELSFTDARATASFTGLATLPGGDINLNGPNLVDIEDYFQLAAAWYQANPAADIDGSGWVDIDDYFLLASHWYLGGDPQ